jgi:hypothetical protein
VESGAGGFSAEAEREKEEGPGPAWAHLKEEGGGGVQPGVTEGAWAWHTQRRQWREWRRLDAHAARDRGRWRRD